MLSDPQWDKIKAIIKLKARKCINSLRVIFTGIFYLLQNGCKWESLPPAYVTYKVSHMSSNYHTVFFPKVSLVLANICN